MHNIIGSVCSSVATYIYICCCLRMRASIDEYYLYTYAMTTPGVEVKLLLYYIVCNIKMLF